MLEDTTAAVPYADRQEYSFNAACGVAYKCVFYFLFFFFCLCENMTQNHCFQFPSKAAVTNVIWLAGQVQIHNSMNKHTI